MVQSDTTLEGFLFAIMKYFVYILTNHFNTVLYTGVTNDIIRRIFEHKQKIDNGFAEKYGLDKLVYFESTNDVNDAIAREKQIKGWRREKKVALINESNPNWKDLFVDML